MSDVLCPICGNSGIVPGTGQPCSCRWNSDTFFSEVSCLSIPVQYQGVMFNKVLVPGDLGEEYRSFMENLYTDITLLRMQYHNIVVCSPHKHSKSVLAYSCIERLFRASLPVFPVCDVMEARNILNAIDLGKEPSYSYGEDPVNLIEAPYLFVKIPSWPTWECFDTIGTLIGRRIRRGHSTVFLYSGSWSQLSYGDKSGSLSQLKGDGSYSTLEVKSFSPNKDVSYDG